MSTGSVNTGNPLECEIPPGNPGKLQEFEMHFWKI
jgi:hypothetical protein